jgi:hypothetical protein
MTSTIPSECHSDDRTIEIEFDTAAWFAQAEPSAIIALADCGWGGDYAADAVADFFSDTTTSDLFTYIRLMQQRRTRETIGFECNVTESDARTWLAANRPDVLAMLRDTED